ncbi:hypothetical protein SAMN05216215_109720 [Saccharopolyspora shandongensis]|uniref:Uncharacterized protein n=1 Tax=Saccharopolyspora shandongensis TaxID=418495 RepID=A0A1H3TYQ4_9PSEU|nr:hypothetical protein [Saccharopolyspora shandongensis]SDZ55330.1 hypothetical protein SAMN05216215_109720 [Saccharopolyspora shandongensis]
MTTIDLQTEPCILDRCQRTAEPGRYTCEPCAERMRRWLREIDDYAATLTTAPGRGGDGGRRSPGYGSRPPANLDVIAALDPRSVAHVIGPDDTDDATRSIIGTVNRLCGWVHSELRRLDADHHAPPRELTITRGTGWLRGYIDWCTRQVWADDLADDLRELHAQVQRLAGNSTRPLAPCWDCGGPLWPVGDTDTLAVRCGDCGNSYDGLDLLNIGQRLAFEMMGTA